MSGNPEIFNASRIQAYAWTRRHGLCGSGRAGFERALLGIRPFVQAANDSLPHAEREQPGALEATARSIAAFCVNRLAPRGRRAYDPVAAAERRAHREALRRSTACWRDTEFLGRLRPPSIRRIATEDRRGAATVHRDLLSHGIAPRRQARIAGMRPLARRIVAVLDLIVPAYDREAVIRLDELAERVYASDWNARSTPATRRARVRRALAEIASAGLGLHPVVAYGLVAVRRGRRWRSTGRVMDAITLRKPCPVPALPEPPADPAIEAAREAAKDLLAMLRIAWRHDQGDAAWRLGHRCAFILDLLPLRRLAETAAERSGEPLHDIAITLHRRKIADFRPLFDFTQAAFFLSKATRFDRDVGEAIDDFVEDSGYAEKAAAGDDGDVARLAAMRSMLAALRGCGWNEAEAMARRWLRGEDLPDPIHEPCSPIENLDDGAETIEIMEKYSIEGEPLSRPAYHKGRFARPEGPERPPPEPIGRSAAA